MALLKHPVPKNLLTLIGDLTVSYALLEYSLQGLASSLIEDHQRVCQIILCEGYFRQLLGMIESLYKERHGEDEDYKQLKGIIKKVTSTNKKRNAITHSIWAAGDNPKSATRIKTTAKKAYRVRFEEIDATFLQSLVDDVQKLAGEILAFKLRLTKEKKVFNNPAIGKPKSLFD